jgi:hypothetical protein
MLGVVAIAAPARGDDAATDPSTLEIHGFASQGFLLTAVNDYLAETRRGSFEFAEAGLNVTKILTDRLRTGVQLFTRDLGPIGDYKVKLDWFYLDYHWRDWLGLRAGRLKLPFGLYNDTADIDAAHSVALLPSSVYPPQNRDFLLAQTGVELYGYRDLDDAGSVEYRAYAGTIFLDLEDQTSAIKIASLTIPYVVGGRLLWDTPLDGLRLGASAQAVRLEGDLLTPAPVSVVVPAVLAVASAEYSDDDLLLAAEYSRWYQRLESSDPMTFPESKTTSERGYGLVAYRINPTFQPGAYYSLYYPDVAQRSGRAARQHDLAITLRVDVNPYWIVKLEGHYMHGTAALSPSLNDGRPRGQLDEDWALFVAKTTAYF